MTPLGPLTVPRYRPMAAIIRATAEAAGLTPEDLRGRARHRAVVGPRHLAMAICRRRGASLGAIGIAFRRDHTTVLHAWRAIGPRLDGDLSAEAARIEARAAALEQGGHGP
jgi:chromosomal replication initiation ATPase DnaA